MEVSTVSSMSYTLISLPLVPPSPIGQHRVSKANVWCGLNVVGLLLAKECQAQETTCCHNRRQANLTFVPEGDIIHSTLDRKQTCSLQRQHYVPRLFTVKMS